MNDTLLTVSGLIPPDIEAEIERGERPLADYIAMARAFGADLLDYAGARRLTGRTGALLERVGGSNLMLAYACYRVGRRYKVVFTDGEQVGIPLAILSGLQRGQPSPRHVMIAHILSVRKKQILFSLFRLQDKIDRFIVYSRWQKRHIEQRWHLPEDRVIFTPFMVDADFFAPGEDGRKTAADFGLPVDRPVISSAGLEFRDYPTLLAAVDGMDLQIVIAAASPWSKRADSTAQRAVPENVLVRRFSQFDLRAIYHLSQFVVVPLYPVNFQAGVTTILEAMAMSRAVICSRTPGQTDIVEDGVTGIYVPPEDPPALRNAIHYLLSHPEIAERMGRLGRQRVLEVMSLSCYTVRLAQILDRERVLVS